MSMCLTRKGKADAELLLEHPQVIAVWLDFVDVGGEQAVVHIMLDYLQIGLQKEVYTEPCKYP